MSKKPTTQTYQRTYPRISSKDELEELLAATTPQVTDKATDKVTDAQESYTVEIKDLAPPKPEQEPEIPTLSEATRLEIACGRETLKKYTI